MKKYGIISGRTASRRYATTLWSTPFWPLLMAALLKVFLPSQKRPLHFAVDRVWRERIAFEQFGSVTP